MKIKLPRLTFPGFEWVLGTAWLGCVTMVAFAFRALPSDVDASSRALSRAALGQFGDTFGALSSLMATLAAIFTWRALMDERTRNDAAERREHERGIEQTFSRLLEIRRGIVEDVAFETRNGLELHGIEAFDAIRLEMKELGDLYGAETYYPDMKPRIRGGANHYFRLTYHTLGILRDNLDWSSAYKHVRIFRAEISDEERFAIALNAVFGPGKPNMLELLNKYHFLHTMPERDQIWLKALPNSGLTESAFESPSSKLGAPT